MRLLGQLILLLAFAAPAAAQTATDPAIGDAVEALRDDPVYVDLDAEAAISESEADELRSAIREAGAGPIYVVILPEQDRPGEDVLRDIAEQVSPSAAYAGVIGNQFRAGGADGAQPAASEAYRAHSREGVHATLLGFVEEFAAIRSGEGSGNDAGGSSGPPWLLLGLLGAGGGAYLLSKRNRSRQDRADLAEVKENIRDDLVALGDEIRALDLDVQMPGANPEAVCDYPRAVDSYDRAETAWERARHVNDLEPVGAALEEGRWAMQAARARLAGEQPPERRAPCFFDPRHGPSTRDVEWAPPGGAPRPVPACEADAMRVEAGDDPHAREVTVGGERVPYWQAGPMYAPVMGGFFGGGLFPGLLMGTMLGSALSPGIAFGHDHFGGDVGGGDFGGGVGGGGDFGGGGFGGGGDF